MPRRSRSCLPSRLRQGNIDAVHGQPLPEILSPFDDGNIATECLVEPEFDHLVRMF